MPVSASTFFSTAARKPEGSSAAETKTPSLVLIPALSSAFSPGRNASVEGLSLGSVASASAEACAGSAKPGRKKTRGLRESVTMLTTNSSEEPDEEGTREREEVGEGGDEAEEVSVVVVAVDDIRPRRKKLAETRTRSTASFSDALLLLLLLPRFLFDAESEGDGRPPPFLASEKKAMGSIDRGF